LGVEIEIRNLQLQEPPTPHAQLSAQAHAAHEMIVLSL
jgi:hypothetical protein